MNGNLEVRRAGRRDAEGLRSQFPAAGLHDKLADGDADKFVVLVAVEPSADEPVGALGIDLGGKTTAPGDPDIFCVAIAEESHANDGASVWRSLHVEAEQVLRDLGQDSLGVSIEVTDAGAIKRYESLGYRPTGEHGPYRELGPGFVEHLHGYTDPVGFVADFAKEL
ncbi:MAG: hypothetical protein VYC34_09020 [Planctomycetota bacterium]|nr:hypothetical protein [Planctomycetota bacterium]